jgi:hypothetical protein
MGRMGGLVEWVVQGSEACASDEEELDGFYGFSRL